MRHSEHPNPESVYGYGNILTENADPDPYITDTDLKPLPFRYVSPEERTSKSLKGPGSTKTNSRIRIDI
jgi:hypothetical protein